jgi:hypothetical protein
MQLESPLPSSLDHIPNPAHTLLHYIPKIRFNIILPSTPVFPKFSFNLRFSN